MRRTRISWHLGLALLITMLLSLGGIPTAAQSPGATLQASDASVVIKNGTITYRRALIEAGGSEDFVGNGFGPGELVSLYITFPDGRVFPLNNSEGNDCCPQVDEALADGTGSIYFELVFDLSQQYPTTTGSATDGVRFTNTIFFLPPEFAVGIPPYGVYSVTGLGRVSLQKATTTFRIVPPGPPGPYDGALGTTGTLLVFTTVGHRTSAPQVDPQLATISAPGTFNGTVAANPNVDISCNGLIPGEFASFWDTYPDGSVVQLSTVAADDGGTAFLQVELLTGKFPTGLHTFTCHGNQSNYYLTGSFLLLPGGISNQSAIGVLTVSYVGASQAVANATFPQLPAFFASDYLQLTARNFRPNETVTFWQTFPDQTAHFLATVKANTAGVAVVVIQLFPGPINFQVGRAILGDAVLYDIAYPAGVDGRIPTGRHFFSARGDVTQRTASTPFDLLPSQVDP